ncbi:hypothetical protein ACEQ8H_003709 [Pleosporales sp. CAS-2024a]
MDNEPTHGGIHSNPRAPAGPAITEHQRDSITRSESMSNALPSKFRDAVRLAQRTAAKATSATTSELPGHREWTELHLVETRDIVKLFRDVQTRCATKHEALDKALGTLDMATRVFLDKSDPLSSAGTFSDYMAALNMARAAGSALFPPQRSYRNAITTLAIFVTDLVDLVPQDANTMLIRQDLEYHSRKAHINERAIRRAMSALAGGLGAQNKRALTSYLLIARMRFETWVEEEEKLTKWAAECIQALK